MADNRKLNEVIPLNMLPFHVIISLGTTDNQFKKFLGDHGLVYDDEMKISGKDGMAFEFKNGPICIRLQKVPFACADYGVLSHEIFHAVDIILRKRMKVTLSDDSEEVYAYTIEFLTTQIFKIINKGL